MFTEILLVGVGATFIFQGIHAISQRSLLHTEHRPEPVTGGTARLAGAFLLFGGTMITFFTLLPGDPPLAIIGLGVLFTILIPALLDLRFRHQRPR